MSFAIAPSGSSRPNPCAYQRGDIDGGASADEGAHSCHDLVSIIVVDDVVTLGGAAGVEPARGERARRFSDTSEHPRGEVGAYPGASQRLIAAKMTKLNRPLAVNVRSRTVGGSERRRVCCLLPAVCCGDPACRNACRPAVCGVPSAAIESIVRSW